MGRVTDDDDLTGNINASVIHQFHLDHLFFFSMRCMLVDILKTVCLSENALRLCCVVKKSEKDVVWLDATRYRRNAQRLLRVHCMDIKAFHTCSCRFRVEKCGKFLIKLSVFTIEMGQSTFVSCTCDSQLL